MQLRGNARAQTAVVLSKENGFNPLTLSPDSLNTNDSRSAHFNTTFARAYLGIVAFSHIPTSFNSAAMPDPPTSPPKNTMMMEWLPSTVSKTAKPTHRSSSTAPQLRKESDQLAGIDRVVNVLSFERWNTLECDSRKRPPLELSTPRISSQKARNERAGRRHHTNG